MTELEKTKSEITPEQAQWAEVFLKTNNGMAAVRAVWPKSKGNSGYQNTRAWKLKTNPRIVAYMTKLKETA